MHVKIAALNFVSKLKRVVFFFKANILDAFCIALIFFTCALINGGKDI